jgi:hypothetical protein
MKRKIRYPMLAAAIVAALGAHAAVAQTTAPAATTHPARPLPPLPRLTEQQKIQALISSIETLKGAVFIRNGSEYDGKKAADHMRAKLKYAGDKIQTAEEFIDALASKSSMSGRPYQIRLPDGRTVNSADYFHAELRKLEAPAVPRTASTQG